MMSLDDDPVVAILKAQREDSRSENAYTRRLAVVLSFCAILISLAGGAGLAVILGDTTQTANDNSQQISTAQTVAAVAKKAASKVTTQVVQVQRQGIANSEAFQSFVTCVNQSSNVGDCIGQKEVPGAVRQGKEGRAGINGRNATQAQVDAAVKKLCGDSCKGDKGADGTDGVNATPDQIASALAAYCSANNGCKGPSGENVAVSPDQVVAAVKAYCDAHGQCKGADGANGQDGAAGATGADGATGPAGADAPPPSQEQVNAGVAAFCAANPAACQAPVAPGPPDPGVTP